MEAVHGADPEDWRPVFPGAEGREGHGGLRRGDREALPPARGEPDHAADGADPVGVEPVRKRRLPQADDDVVRQPDPRVDGVPVLGLEAGEAGGGRRPEGGFPAPAARRQQQVVDEVYRQPRAGVVGRPAAVLLEPDHPRAEAPRPDDRPPFRRSARQQLDHRARSEAGAGFIARPDAVPQAGDAVVGRHPERAGALGGDGLDDAADGEVGQRGAVVEAGREGGGGAVDAVEAQESTVGADPEGRPAGLRPRQGESAHILSPQGRLLDTAVAAAVREAAGDPCPDGSLAVLDQRADQPGRHVGARRIPPPGAVPEAQQSSFDAAEPEAAVARRQRRPGAYRGRLAGDRDLLPGAAVVADRPVRPDVPLEVLDERRIAGLDAVAPGEQAPWEPAVGVGGEPRRRGLDDGGARTERRCRGAPSPRNSEDGSHQQREKPSFHRINREL
jgi:hypothetical protein